MSDLSSAISALSNTGLEYYAVSQGQPLSVTQGTVGGVPYSTSSVGSLVTPGSISSTTVIIVAVALVLILFLYKRG